MQQKANPDDPRLKITAQEQTKSSVSDLKSAQGSGILIDNPVQREIKDGELISGVADAEKGCKSLQNKLMPPLPHLQRKQQYKDN